MSRAIGSWILLNIFLMRCRGSFLYTTRKEHASRIWLIVLSSGISVLLALFSRWDSRYRTQWLVYTKSDQFISSWAWISLLMWALILSIISYFAINTFPKKISIRSLAILMLIIVSILISYYFWSTWTLLSRALIATLEEWTKTSANLAFFDRFKITSSDCLFFWLLSALWFAFTENIVYLFSLDIMNVGNALWMIITRMCTSRMMHLSYSWLIALWIYAWQNAPHSVIKPISFLLWWVILHTVFNYFLQTQSIFSTFIILLSCYFFLTWLLYKSDRIYLWY